MGRQKTDKIVLFGKGDRMVMVDSTWISGLKNSDGIAESSEAGQVRKPRWAKTEKESIARIGLKAE